jgi:hypothetical protein
LRDRGRRAIRDCENGSAGCEEEKNRGRVGRRSRRGWSGRRSSREEEVAVVEEKGAEKEECR